MRLLWTVWVGSLQSLIFRNLFYFLEGNIYYISVNIIKPEGMKKHFAFRETHLCYLSYLNQTKHNKMTKKRIKKTIILKTPSWRDSTSPLPFCWKFTVSRFFPPPTPLLKSSLFLFLDRCHPKDWRPWTLLYFKCLIVVPLETSFSDRF